MAGQRAGACADRLVEPIFQQLLDHLLVGLRHLPVQEIVRPYVGPPFVPGPVVSDERDPHVRPEAEVMAATQAHVVVVAQVLDPEPHAASRAVGRKQDLGQRAAPHGDLVRAVGDHSERPPSTAMTWPVMKPARSEHRNATAAATSSAVPSRLIGVSLTSSPTISSVSDPEVSSVRTYPGATALHVMLRDPYSRATDFVNPIRPALAAA